MGSRKMGTHPIFHEVRNMGCVPIFLRPGFITLEVGEEGLPCRYRGLDLPGRLVDYEGSHSDLRVLQGGNADKPAIIPRRVASFQSACLAANRNVLEIGPSLPCIEGMS